ncbi:hypothetical protein F5Y12DRAFT_730076, partial [Xylaria sp. FL1777]
MGRRQRIWPCELCLVDPLVGHLIASFVWCVWEPTAYSTYLVFLPVSHLCICTVSVYSTL